METKSDYFDSRLCDVIMTCVYPNNLNLNFVPRLNCNSLWFQFNTCILNDN